MIRKLALQAHEKRQAEELALKHSRETQEYESNIEALNCWLKKQNVNFKALEPSIYLGDGLVLKPAGEVVVFVEKTCTCGEQVRSRYCSTLADVGREIDCFLPADMIHQQCGIREEEGIKLSELNDAERQLVDPLREVTHLVGSLKKLLNIKS